MEMFRGRLLALALWLVAGSAFAQSDDILPQRQGPLTRYDSIEAALDAPKGETVLVIAGLDENMDASPRTRALKRRLSNVIEVARHAMARDVPIHVLVDNEYPNVPAALEQLLENYPKTLWMGYQLEDGTSLPDGELLMQDYGAPGVKRSWFEQMIDMSKTRNIVLVTADTASAWPAGVAPLFEAVWNRLNVYTNANLIVSEIDVIPATTLFLRRLDQSAHFGPDTVPRALPASLMEDPYLHWVPMGAIPFAPVPDQAVDYRGGFDSAGLPLEHRYAAGAPPFPARDEAIVQAPYDSRAMLLLGFRKDEEEYRGAVMGKALARERARSALVKFDQAFVAELKTAIDGHPTHTWASRIRDEGLHRVGDISAFLRDSVPRHAYREGRAEIVVNGHGMFAGDEYLVGRLPARQLAALLMQHEGLGIAQALAADGKAHVAHLDILSCGRRCEADYKPTPLDQGLTDNEVEYAREVVRSLAAGNVIVERVSVRNVPILVEQVGPSGSWYVTYGPDGVPVHVFEPKLLTTTEHYHPDTGRFTDGTEQARLAGRLSRLRPMPLDGYVDRLLAPGPTRPLDGNSTVPATPWPATDAARAGVTHAGGIVRLFPRNDLKPRLTRFSDQDDMMVIRFAKEAGTVLVPADVRALQAGLRMTDGKVVIVDSEPAQLRGVRLALSLAEQAADEQAWVDEMLDAGMGDGAGSLFFDEAMFRQLQARLREGRIVVHDVDLGSSGEAAHVVNASLGDEPVVLAVLPGEGRYLEVAVRTGVESDRADYLRQLRENIALLLGPETTLHQNGMRVEGEAAYRARVGLPRTARTSTPPPPVSPAVTITADAIEHAHWMRMLAAVAADANVTTTQREAVQEAMADVQRGGAVHRAWATVRSALAIAGEAVRNALTRLLRGLGIVDRTSYSPHLSPQDYEATFARDGLRLGIDAAHVAEALHEAHEDTLRSAGLDPADYVPVLQSAHRPPSPCALDAGACGATLHAAVDYDIHFLPVDGREGVEVVRTRDPAFAEAHAFVEGFGVRNGHVGLVAAPEGGGGGVHTMNAAFALMGLARALEGARAHAPEVADNLATSLQVQMYLNEAQAVHGVVGDVMQVVQLAREGLQEARLAQVGAEASASMGTRLLGMAGQASRGAAMVLQGVLIGFDAYHLAHAQTEGQRAMFGTQLGLDSAGLALTLAAWTAELAGFAAVSAVADTLALPLVGIGIGVMGLVEVFSATASDVDEVARKFNRFGDLYPREPLTNREKRWFDATEANWQPGMPPLPHAPDAAELRDRAAFTYDAKTRLLSPVFGVALQEIDLRTRDALGQRHVRFAESYIDRMDMNSLSAGHLISDRNTITSMNPPRPDPKAAPIPILARMGGAPTGKLVRVEDRQAPVEVLVLPATPVSRFGGYTYNNLPFGIFRHVYDQDFMGYTVLRALEEIDWAKGVFMFDFYLTAIDHSMNHIVEALQPTPVRVLLDEQVQVVALPDFTVAPDPKYTEAQLRAYGEHARLVMGAMQYTLSPAVRTAPYTIALQAGYGRGMTLEAPASGGATWILDARHLQAPDDIRDVRLVPAGGGQPARGELTIAGMPIVVHGAGAEITAWVTMPHGVWQVDFAGGTLRSHDVLAASDLVHGQRVKEALSRKLFAWRSDSFVEVAVPAGGGAYVIHGTPVSRYYASVRDEALVHAIDDAAYPQARLVFGDASEAYYHDDHAGLLYRVPHGQVRPTHRYVIGPRQGAIAAPHALRYIDRLAAGRMLLLVEYERRPLAYLDTAWVRANAVADTVERMTAVYELEAGTLRLVRLLNHNRLSAFLEDGDRATPDGVAYAGIAGYIGSLMQGSFIAPAAAAGMATVLPQYAGFIGVRGMLQGARGPEPYQHWIRASDGWLLKPIFPGGAACGAGGAADGLKLRQAVYSAGCGRSVPGDAQLVGVYEGPSREGAGAVAVPWYRFYAPSTQTFYGTRMYAPSHAQGAVYPRTQVVGVRDGRMDDALVAADAQGLLWDYLADEAPRLRGVGAAWTAARAARWLVDLRALAEATPEVHPVLVVDGLRGPAGALSAWYLPEAGVLALAPVAQAQWVAFDGGRHVATVRDAGGTLWTVPTFAVATAAQATEVMATFFEQRTLRAAPKATRLAAPPEAALVSAGARQDAQCRGVYATYANGAGVCHDGLGAPQVLELRHCEAGAALPAWPGLRVQAAALTCARNAQGAPAAAGEAVARVQRTGWRSARGAVIAAPTDPDLADAGAYRVLGFNDAAQRAYYFHPGESLLYIADFAGTTQSRHWLEDAQVLGDGLLLRLAREPLPASAIPRIDGVDALGIASAGRRAVTYTLDAATWDHYARIVVDMGGVPAGPWRHHELRLAFGDASYLEVQRRPGGWLAQDPLTGRHVEMRGRGGNKTLVFGDRNERLDLTEVEPVRFADLPATGYRDHGYASSWAPASDRHDVNGDGVADLVRLVGNGHQKFLSWALRRADGSIGSTSEYAISSGKGFPVPAAGTRPFYAVNGQLFYCGLDLGANGVAYRMYCFEMDARGFAASIHLDFDRHAPGKVPTPADDLTWHVQDLVRRSRDWTWHNADRAHVRFDGRDLACSAVAGETACTATRPPVYNALQLARACTAAQYATPTHWCARERAKLDPRIVQEDWGGDLRRMNQGRAECATYDGRTCLAGLRPQDLDPARLQPLVCGPMHKALGIAANDPHHWCQASIPAPPPPPVPEPEGHAPVVSDLRITGTWAVGSVLTGHYAYRDADGDPEGASDYQWYVGQPGSDGVAVPVPGANQRTFTLRAEDQGAQRSVWFNVERVRAGSGVPNVGKGASVRRTGAIEGRAPQAIAPSVAGVPQAGQAVTAQYRYADADGDAEAGTTFQWYRHKPGVYLHAIPGATGPAYAVQAADVGAHRLLVRITPRAATGIPATGTQVEAQTASDVIAAPHYENGTDVAIHQHLAVESPIHVYATGTASQVRVRVQLRHTCSGTLQIDLMRGGVAYPLRSASGTCPASQDMDAVFTGYASGASKYGTWSLRIRSTYGSHTGTLDRWTLDFL